MVLVTSISVTYFCNMIKSCLGDYFTLQQYMQRQLIYKQELVLAHKILKQTKIPGTRKKASSKTETELTKVQIIPKLNITNLQRLHVILFTFCFSSAVVSECLERYFCPLDVCNTFSDTTFASADAQFGFLWVFLEILNLLCIEAILF